MKITIQVLIEGAAVLPQTVPIQTIDRRCELLGTVSMLRVRWADCNHWGGVLKDLIATEETPMEFIVWVLKLASLAKLSADGADGLKNLVQAAVTSEPRGILDWFDISMRPGPIEQMARKVASSPRIWKTTLVPQSTCGSHVLPRTSE